MDSTEPEYIAQCAHEDVSPDQGAQGWILERVEESKARGMTWHRATIDPDQKLVLVEGWRVRPSSQGEPRFIFTAR